MHQQNFMIFGTYKLGLHNAENEMM